MEIFLLLIIVIIEFARLIISWKQAKMYKERTERASVCTTISVDHIFLDVDEINLNKEVESWGRIGFEFVNMFERRQRIDGIKEYTLVMKKKRISADY